MRTVTFKSVLFGVAMRLSLDPTKNLPADVARALCEYINTRVRKGWNMFAWPNWTFTEERQFRASYDNAAAYVIGDEVYYADENKYYIATAAGTGNLPTDTNFWAEATELDRYVAAVQDWEEHELGDVVSFYKEDPRTTSTPAVVQHWESPNGFQVGESAGSVVWVEFREPAPLFTTPAWSAATSYPAGSLVYLSATGECYKAMVDVSVSNPAESPEQWARVLFPECLAEYVKLAAQSDALREDESVDKADRIEASAVDFLYDEIDKARRSRRQTNRWTARVK